MVAIANKKWVKNEKKICNFFYYLKIKNITR